LVKSPHSSHSYVYNFLIVSLFFLSGEQSSEINVIPVGDMFALKKASLVQDELLADVDERFIQEVQRNKGNINKYKG